MLNRVDQRRSPRTEATVNELLDRRLEVIDVERTMRSGCVGKIEEHIRPMIGRLPVRVGTGLAPGSAGPAAIGTSLVILGVNSLAGLAAHLGRFSGRFRPSSGVSRPEH